ncbi:MAG: phospholipase [Deltaproteobacteria bacterium]|nr:phospholipase [Deltaproteobacteria bacterium]
MKKQCLYLLIFLVSLIPIAGTQAGQYDKNVAVDLCFTPGGTCSDRIISEIGNARSEILVQAYSFTSAQIGKALIDAHKRGVKVEAILDRSQRTAKYSWATFLANMRIPTYIDSRHAIAHNKIIIIDSATTITGSFNFTKAAQDRNAENLLVIRSKEIARAYRENWFDHRKHSEQYEARY